MLCCTQSDGQCFSMQENRSIHQAHQSAERKQTVNNANYTPTHTATLSETPLLEFHLAGVQQRTWLICTGSSFSPSVVNFCPHSCSRLDIFGWRITLYLASGQTWCGHKLTNDEGLVNCAGTDGLQTAERVPRTVTFQQYPFPFQHIPETIFSNIMNKQGNTVSLMTSITPFPVFLSLS